MPSIIEWHIQPVSQSQASRQKGSNLHVGGLCSPKHRRVHCLARQCALWCAGTAERYEISVPQAAPVLWGICQTLDGRYNSNHLPLAGQWWEHHSTSSLLELGLLRRSGASRCQRQICAQLWLLQAQPSMSLTDVVTRCSGHLQIPSQLPCTRRQRSQCPLDNASHQGTWRTSHQNKLAGVCLVFENPTSLESMAQLDAEIQSPTNQIAVRRDEHQAAQMQEWLVGRPLFAYGKATAHEPPRQLLGALPFHACVQPVELARRGLHHFRHLLHLVWRIGWSCLHLALDVVVQEEGARPQSKLGMRKLAAEHFATGCNHMLRQCVQLQRAHLTSLPYEWIGWDLDCAVDQKWWPRV